MIEAIALYLASSAKLQEFNVGYWKIACESAHGSEDGQFESRRVTYDRDGISVTILRDSTGAKFSAKTESCKPIRRIEESARTAEDLAGENATKMFMGGVIQQILWNCRESSSRPSTMIIPITEPEASQILSRTEKLRPKAANAQTH